jgi:enamine deaminase RidA (YjgF/YER057c/UK114 family)
LYRTPMGIEGRLRELGIELPPPPQAVASYVPVSITGNLAFVSGQVPMAEGKLLWTGRLGDDLEALSALRAHLGSLDRVQRIVRLGVFVVSAPGFNDQSKVANGASDLLTEVLGDAGRHSRTAVGVPELPLGAPVEVEMLAEIS